MARSFMSAADIFLRRNPATVLHPLHHVVASYQCGFNVLDTHVLNHPSPVLRFLLILPY